MSIEANVYSNTAEYRVLTNGKKRMRMRIRVIGQECPEGHDIYNIAEIPQT
jgi:hypothetical protein